MLNPNWTPARHNIMTAPVGLQPMKVKHKIPTPGPIIPIDVIIFLTQPLESLLDVINQSDNHPNGIDIIHDNKLGRAANNPF